MQDKLRNLATFEVKIGGMSFRVRHRITALMMQIGDASKVFGLHAQARDKELTPEQQDKFMEKYLKERTEMESKVCPVALASIDGVPFDPSAHEVSHVAGVILDKFLLSGLEADPTDES